MSVFMPREDVNVMTVPGEILQIVDAVHPYGYVAGSAARYAVLPEYLRQDLPYNDIDVFLLERENRDNVVDRLEKHGWKHVDSTENSWEFERGNFAKVQLILPKPQRYGLPWHVLQNFDFTVNCYALLHEKDGLKSYHHPDSRPNVEDRRLVFVTTRFVDPPAMAQRIAKYHKKGFSVSPRLFAQLFQAWDRLDSTTKAERLVNQERIQEVYGSYDG